MPTPEEQASLDEAMLVFAEWEPFTPCQELADFMNRCGKEHGIPVIPRPGTTLATCFVIAIRIPPYRMGSQLKSPFYK
jgi:hypothetical protein